LRIGFSAAKGIAYGAKLPIISVPTYEALAHQLSKILKEGEKFIICNKVNKDEVYFAKFQIKGNSYIFVDDLAVRKNESFIDVVGRLPVFGNAAVLLSENLKFPVSPDPRFIAKWAIEYGENSKTFDYDFLEPNYLKNFLIKENSK
ncbi:MAG: hypothetical protein KJO48_10085, partial [Ignavibacteria bacterium]|nr:hypothetical protein [Ignavibacteria bacterium]